MPLSILSLKHTEPCTQAQSHVLPKVSNARSAVKVSIPHSDLHPPTELMKIVGHFSRDCPQGGGGGGACHNCGEEGHRKQDCTSPRKIVCRNCDAEGHESRECPLPRDYSRVKCSNCQEMGHTKVRCKAPIKADEEGGDAGGYGGGDAAGYGGVDSGDVGGNADYSGGGGDSWGGGQDVAASGGW